MTELDKEEPIYTEDDNIIVSETFCGLLLPICGYSNDSYPQRFPSRRPFVSYKGYSDG
jgi:hypothetical protein